MTFEAVPQSEIEPHNNGAAEGTEPPKRGRGRPRKDGSTDVAPRRPRQSKINLEVRIGAFIAQVNIGVMIAAQFVPGMDAERDPLEPAEIIALAKALEAEARNHAQFRKYLERFLAVGSAGQLWLVVAIIAARRGARHGFLPEGLDAPLGLALADPAAFASMVTPPPPEPAPADAVTA